MTPEGVRSQRLDRLHASGYTILYEAVILVKPRTIKEPRASVLLEYSGENRPPISSTNVQLPNDLLGFRLVSGCFSFSVSSFSLFDFNDAFRLDDFDLPSLVLHFNARNWSRKGYQAVIPS